MNESYNNQPQNNQAENIPQRNAEQLGTQQPYMQQPYIQQPNIQQPNMPKKMKPCKKCGAMIDSKAKTCQYCGAKNGSKAGCAIGLIAVIVFVTILLSPADTDSVSSNEPTSTSSTSSTAEASSIVSTAPISKEEYVNKCRTYTFEEISRRPDYYKGEFACFEGQVIQVLEYGDEIALRINITKEPNEFADGGYLWSDTILISYIRKSSDEPHILEEDIVYCYGVLDGNITYEGLLDNSVTVPHLKAEYVDIVNM